MILKIRPPSRGPPLVPPNEQILGAPLAVVCTSHGAQTKTVDENKMDQQDFNVNNLDVRACN